MSLILNIDTAVAGASIALSQDDRVLAFAANEAAKESAGWLQPAVRELMAGSGFSLSALDAIAVSAGPGSYTGLRVGMASAKGLCYALNKPLITVGTLEAMAAAAIQQVPDVQWFCPMIDARRMEVFTGIYNRELQVIVAPHNLVLDAGSFSEQLSQQQICFLGNGSDKFKPLVPAEKGVFASVTSDAAQIAALAFQRYVTGDFADLAYAEPFYIKAFYSTQTGI